MNYLKRSLIILFSLIFIGASPIAVSASFGSGAAVIAAELNLVKAGVAGEKICFKDTDFKAALGITDFKKITVKSLPDESEGLLIYAGRRASSGQVIKRRNIASLVFLPASEDVKEARFSFSAEGFADGKTVECIMRFTKKQNHAPVTFVQAAFTAELEDGKVKGQMHAIDPEADAVEFLIAAYPKYGALEADKDGKYVYTPTSDFKGEDSFSYVARDSFGNWSEISSIKIKI